MATDDLEERVFLLIKQHNERNEPIGKKKVYDQKFAAITTVQKAIKSLIAKGRIIEHLIALPRGTYCLLIVTKEEEKNSDAIRQKILDMIFFQAQKNGETLEKLLNKFNRIERGKKMRIAYIEKCTECGQMIYSGEDARTVSEGQFYELLIKNGWTYGKNGGVCPKCSKKKEKDPGDEAE